MIVVVKRNRKQKIMKFISLAVLVAMFSGYYFYMSFEEKQRIELEEKKAEKLKTQTEKKYKKNLEITILTEIEKAVDLIGQKYIQHVKIIDNKVVIICEPKTNLDALKVRYRSMALIKNTLNEIIIAIDIKYIVESRLNAKQYIYINNLSFFIACGISEKQEINFSKPKVQIPKKCPAPRNNKGSLYSIQGASFFADKKDF